MLTTLTSLLSRLRPRRPRDRAIAGLSAVLVVAAVLGGVWAFRIAQRAEALGQELRATAGAARDTIITADELEIARLRATLAETAPLAREFESDLWPLRMAGAVIGWYPVLGDNVAAAPKLASRLVDDVDAALAFVEASELLVHMYDAIPQEASGITATLDALPSMDEINAVTVLIYKADEALARAEETSTSVNDRRLWGRIGSEAKELRKQEAELRELIDWSLLATDALRALAQLSDATEGLAAVIDSGDTSQLDGSVLRRMPALEIAAKGAFEAVAAAVGSAPGAVQSSPIGRNLRDLEPVLDALHATARAGSLVSAVITPAFKPVESSGGGLFGPGSGIMDTIALIGERVGLLLEADKLLVQSRIRLLQALPLIETPSAASAAAGLLALSRELELSVGLLRDLPELGPPALGIDGPRRYLVLAESADEIRPSGGLVSGAWVLTFNRGELVTSVYHDVVEIDDLTSLSSYPAPPELLANHMDASVWLLRDVGWEPHFPSVARSAARILALGQDGLQVDGVIVLTQWAMLGITEAIGSIETDRGPIPADRFLSALEAGTDEEGRAFMNAVFQGLLDQISGPTINGKLFKLARATSLALNQNQILVHMFDDDLQAIVSRAGWDGVIPDTNADRIAPVDSNIGWSKVDRNIERSLDYEVTLTRSGPSTAKVTLGYKNASDANASGCDVQRLEPGKSYTDLKNACYWNLLRVYTAEGAVLVSADPLPLPAKSVYARLGLGGAGDDTVVLGSSPAGSFVGGLIVVPPGEERRTSFTLQLPASAVTWDGDRATYTLELAAQPGTRGRETKVWVEMPSGYEFVSGSVIPASIAGRTVRFDFPLTENTTLSLQMQRTTPPNAALLDGEPVVRAQ
ncbi:MAG: DUF4012 domain-containing protein [Chloroflexi bacterium]|nr:DUF4012 domain-containing protein [Chloroflexota bacterium]